MALVAFSDDPHRALQAMAPLVDALGTGRQLGPVLWVRGDEWTDLTTVTRGRVSRGTVSLMGAEFAVRGRVMPRSSREEPAAEPGDAVAIQAVLPEATRRFDSLGAAERPRLRLGAGTLQGSSVSDSRSFAIVARSGVPLSIFGTRLTIAVR